MVVVCPTVTAYDMHEYTVQLKRATRFAKRIHIDLMDGQLAPTHSPTLDDIWLPHHIPTDIHLMYQHPMEVIDKLIRLQPRMVIIHSEASVHHMHFAAELHKHGIEAGLAILQQTPVAHIQRIIHSFDHVLVFSGNLGHHGGQADLGLLNKVTQIREHHADVEIGWDGGVNQHNIKQLVAAGVDVLNVGGAIQKAAQPEHAYATLKQIANETND